MSEHRLQKVRQRLIRDDVLSSLRAAILEGVFQPGERLIETDLAEQLGTSRGPVRDALKELAQEGLVISSPHKGAVVATFTADDVQQIYELRSLLEGYATRKAAQKATPADIDRLQTLYEDMKACAERDDLSALVEKDIEFHREICRLSGNPRLYKVWSAFVSQIRLFLTLADQVFFEPGFIVETHTLILEGIRRKDADLAERAVKEHMLEVGRTVMRGVQDESVG